MGAIRRRSVEECIAACEASDRIGYFYVLVARIQRTTLPDDHAALMLEARQLLEQIERDMDASAIESRARYGADGEIVCQMMATGFAAFRLTLESLDRPAAAPAVVH